MKPEAFQEIIRDLEAMLSTKMDYWKEPHMGNPFVHLMVSGPSRRMFEITMLKLEIPFKVLIDDVGVLVREQIVKNSIGSRMPNDPFDFSKYHPLEDINNWMVTVENLFPKWVSVFNVSHSYQQRDIYAMKISIPNASKKPAIWFDGGIHAREW